MIFRFNRYSKRSYIIKLLKDNFHVILDEGETYKRVADDILIYNNIKNYKRYIRNIYLEKFLSRLDYKKSVRKDDVKEVTCKYNNNNIFREKICFYPPCLKTISDNNYCSNHKDKKYDF